MSALSSTQAGSSSVDYLSDASPPNLPAAYKHTELGMLPEDWECTPLRGECERVTKGTTPTTVGRAFTSAGVLFLKAEAIAEDGGVVPEKAAYIDEATHALLARSQLAAGDLLVSIAGVLGRVGHIEASDLPANVNQALAIIRLSRRASIVRDFLFWCLRGPAIQGQIRDINVQAAQANISLENVRDFILPLPSRQEQCAIAEALFDAGRLLGTVEVLIAKKKAIKLAAMQQLLTGTTRLPGFSGEWETKRLGDFVSFLRHGTNSRAELSNAGSVRYLHYGDIHTSSGVFLDPRLTPMPYLATERARTLDRLQDGDLVLVDASEDLDGVGKSVEIAGAAGTEVVAGLHTIGARFDKAILADGFKAYLQFCPVFRDHLKRLAAGTKVYATNRSHVASAEIPLPSAEEQVAIASILSDMDAEIAALNARREKTRGIKQGMMQQLLTGHVRLVKPVSEKASA